MIKLGIALEKMKAMVETHTRYVDKLYESNLSNIAQQRSVETYWSSYNNNDQSQYIKLLQDTKNDLHSIAQRLNEKTFDLDSLKSDTSYAVNKYIALNNYAQAHINEAYPCYKKDSWGCVNKNTYVNAQDLEVHTQEIQFLGSYVSDVIGLSNAVKNAEYYISHS
jgi:phosphoribosylamine-glycine ligase